MKTLNHYLFCFLIIGFFLISINSERVSAQVKKLTTEELTNQSEVIAVGRVTALHSEWNEDKTRIYTKVTISVDQYVKGEPSERTLTITHLGGEVGEIGELYTHTPKFFQDEEVLVFVKKDKEDNLRITGGENGKMRITTNEKTGKKMVGQNKTLKAYTTEVENIVKKQKEK